ncbi:MAG: Arc family DNA-binding protein [Fimbriimonadales bacterium]
MAKRKPFLLRLSPELWDEIQRMAQEELRSVNAQIEYLLRDAIARRRGKQWKTPPPDEESSEPAENG